MVGGGGNNICSLEERPHIRFVSLGFAGEATQGVRPEHTAVMNGPDPTGTDVILHQLIGDSYVMLHKICSYRRLKN